MIDGKSFALVQVENRRQHDEENPPPPRPMVSKLPWVFYDALVQGQPIAEIARKANVSEAQVEVDVEWMRERICELHKVPLTDDECDDLRGIYNMIDLCRADATGGAMKVQHELEIRRRHIINTARERNEETLCSD